MAMTVIWTFICDLRGGCGAIIKIKTDRWEHGVHPFGTCPVCHKNTTLKGKE